MLTMQRRAGLVLVAASVLVGGLIYALVTPPANDAYVGLTPERLDARLGKPAAMFPGHYGLPEYHWAKQHEPCMTYTYQRWNGTL